MNIEIGAHFYLSMFFGIIGMGYFVYGKKQARFIALFAGMGLMVFPYFIPEAITLFAASAGLMAVPFILK